MKSESQFTDAVRQVIEVDGEGIAFLIGSGVSASSGIMMGQEFTDYLGFTVYYVIEKQWDLQAHGWPTHPKKDEVDSAKKFIFDKFSDLCRGYGLSPVLEKDQKFVVRGLERLHGTDGKTFASGEIGSIDQLLLNLNVPLIPQILCYWSAHEIESKRKALYQSLHQQTPFEGWRAPTLLSPTSREYLIEKGIRSLSDWRATLEFLASIVISNGKPMVSGRDGSLIDQFNTHITRNKKPNLTHTMIAHLMRPLRSRFILTTNFDELLEESFRTLKEPLAEYPVSAKGHLPSSVAVRAMNCLIKLHGGLLETRADFSLDAPPEEADTRTFVKYFCGEESWKPPPGQIIQRSSNGIQHLLVIGYSGRDQRTIHLIKSVMDSHPSFKVYWICHSEEDKNRVSKLFTEESYSNGQINLFISQRPDLLLYELYQSVTRSLPGGGFSFPYSPNTPPLRIAKKDSSSSTDAQQEIFISEVKNELLSQTHPFKIVTVDGKSGVTHVVNRLFEDLSISGYSPLWLELEDYHSPLGFLFELLQSMALKLGLWQLEHVALLPRNALDDSTGKINEKALRDHLERLMRYMGVAANRWIVFVYGRNGAGGCSGLFPEYWKDSDFANLHNIFKLLLEQNLRIFYLPYSVSRSNHDSESRDKILLEDFVSVVNKSNAKNWSEGDTYERELFIKTKEQYLPSPFDITVDAYAGSASMAPKKTPSMRATLEEVLGVGYKFADDRLDFWIDLKRIAQGKDGDSDSKAESLRKLQFLYAITLFRQSRHVTALLSEATFRCPHRFNYEGHDNDHLRSDFSVRWVRELQDRGFLLLKPGGYNWCYRDVRMGAQWVMESLSHIEVGGGVYSHIGQMRARTHFWIADWYQKAYSTTGHYTPLIEAIFHRLECVRFSPFAKLPSKDSTSPDNQRYRFELAADSLAEIVKLLQVGRGSLKLWLAGGDGWRLFETSGLKKLLLHLTDNIDQFEGANVLNELDSLIREVANEFNSVRYSLCAESGRPMGKVCRFGLVKHKDMTSTLLGASFAQVAASNDDQAWRVEFKDFFMSNQLKRVCVGDDSLFAIIDQFLIPNSVTDPSSAAGNLRRSIPKWRASWHGKKGVISRSNIQPRLAVLIWSVFELAYFYARRAKIIAHAHNVRVPSCDQVNCIMLEAVENEARDRVLRHWVIVSALCWLAIDLCKSLSEMNRDLEVSTKVKASTLYGLALGYLGRFSEAHRRLNEGHAIMSRSSEGLGGINLAVLHLRRAEVYFAQAEVRCVSLKQSSQKLDGLAYSLMDDGWVTLEKAEAALSGVTHNTLWWGRLYSLQMRALSLFRLLDQRDRESIWVNGRLPLAFRRRVQIHGFVERLLDKALLETQNDPYKTLRVIRYFFGVHGAYALVRSPSELLEAMANERQRLDTIAALELPQLVRLFCELVIEEADSAIALVKEISSNTVESITSPTSQQTNSGSSKTNRPKRV